MIYTCVTIHSYHVCATLLLQKQASTTLDMTAVKYCLFMFNIAQYHMLTEHLMAELESLKLNKSNPSSE